MTFDTRLVRRNVEVDIRDTLITITDISDLPALHAEAKHSFENYVATFFLDNLFYTLLLKMLYSILHLAVLV